MVKVVVDEFGKVEADLRPAPHGQEAGEKYIPTPPTVTKKKKEIQSHKFG